MTEIRFVTREIGSLAKPGWRVKAISGRPVEERDIEEAQKWGERLGVERVGDLTEILRKGEGFTDGEREMLIE
jgi:5-methyltetrahydropteroyltriglutamate--homocysteine methyltransferase